MEMSKLGIRIKWLILTVEFERLCLETVSLCVCYVWTITTIIVQFKY